MPPEIMKTLLLDEWCIVTRITKKDGYATAHEGHKYPVPKETIEQIAYDYLIKEAEGCEKGYTFTITNKTLKEAFKVTVERITKDGF